MILARSCRHTTYFAALSLLLLAPLDALALSCDDPLTYERCDVLGLDMVDIPCLEITRAPESCYMSAEYTCDDDSVIELIMGGSDLHYIKRGAPVTLYLFPSDGIQYPLSLRWRHLTPQGFMSGEERIEYLNTRVTDGDEYGEDYDCVGGEDDCSFYCASTPAKTPPAPLYAALIALITWRHRRRQP